MYIVLILASSIIGVAVAPDPCSIKVTDLPHKQPIYVNARAATFVETVLYATGSSLNVDVNEQIRLFCPDKFEGQFQNEVVTATCVKGSQFKIGNKLYDLKQLACGDTPPASILKTGQKCDGGEIIEVGFQIPGGIWIPTYRVCYDHSKFATKWTHLQLKPTNKAIQWCVPRAETFVIDDLYGAMKINAHYSINVQYSRILETLNSEALADRYVKYYSEEEPYTFLSRGHLGAYGDFVLGAHQASTMRYLNVAPQWQGLNELNWNKIEIDVLTYVAKQNIEFDVYTGTHDVLGLKDAKGVPKDIYLISGNKYNTPKLPVPKFFYKIVMKKNSNEGIVFIGVNNPHVTVKEIEAEYILCNDISDLLDKKTFKFVQYRKDVVSGYCYTCSIEDFRKNVRGLPPLPDTTKNLAGLKSKL